MLSQLTRLPRVAKLAVVLSVDALLGAVAVWTAMFLRVGGVPRIALEQLLIVTVMAFLLVPSTGLLFGVYRSVIRFAAPGLSIRIALVSFTSGAAFGVVAFLGGGNPAKAFGFAIVFALVLFTFQVLIRQAARWFVGEPRTVAATRVAVYGAGAAGRQLVTLMRETRDFAPVLFIDDDHALRGRAVDDLLVVSPQERRFAKRLASYRVREILLAIPSLKPGRRREILEQLAQLPYRVRIVPGLAELVKGETTSIVDVRDVSVEDLLGRETVPPLPGLLDKCIKGKTVLISGGGGSIGSELCRQVLHLAPSRLVVVEHSEFALYTIEQELRGAAATSGQKVQLDFVLGSITDAATVAELFAREHVDTVYHAAAYKHVPIVEGNPLEGFKNNVLGTWHLARAAAKAKVGHFVLISSDKAVRPTNVMGATKRMAEIVVQVLSETSPNTVFSMVRFGNVLESSGSVVPLFRSQIEAGGPVTLTHMEVSRYFMSIQEAVQLVIQAGALARGGEVFVLDMGAPVKIHDLALRMIRLSGRSIRDRDNPKGDIAIVVIGLRPGEKLFEELLISGEATATAHPRICKVREASAPAMKFEAELQLIREELQRGVLVADIRHILGKWVTGYAPTVPAEAQARMGERNTREPVHSVELGFGKV